MIEAVQLPTSVKLSLKAKVVGLFFPPLIFQHIFFCLIDWHVLVLKCYVLKGNSL